MSAAETGSTGPTGTVTPRSRRGLRTELRVRVRQGRARMRSAWFPVLQASVAAGAAWAVGYYVLGHPYPFFATVAAWVCLGFSPDRQIRRVAELAAGVALGVALGDLVVHWIGAGPWQVAVVLFVAAMLARFLDRGQMVTMQAGVQAMVIVGLPLVGASGGPVGRWTDAAAGGLVALAVAVLTPQDPRRRHPGSARDAVLLAPLAVLPLAVGAAAVAVVGDLVGLPAPALGLLFVALLALGSRALHWDGLSDTVDGLTASYDPARSLEVMKSGTSGPAGVLATVLVAGLQVVALSTLLTSPSGVLLAALLVCVSRAALTLTCLRGVPPARRDGMGQPLAGVVPLAGAAAVWLLALAAITGTLVWSGEDWWRGPVAVLTAALVVLALLRRTTRRFGGVTGDVYGASVELAFTALLLAVQAT